jgi:hypothetical protein
MATVSLNEAARLVDKSTSTITKQLKKGTLKGEQNDKNVWRIDTDDLFALYPEIDAQKIKRLENELKESKNTILLLEEKLKDEMSKREELKHLLEESNQKKAEDIRKVKVVFEKKEENNTANVFLREHIDKLINAVEPFSSSYYSYISPSMCLRLLANYTSEFDKFQTDKNKYKDDCRRDPNNQWESKDKLYEKFVYSITNTDILKFIVTGNVPNNACSPFGQDNSLIINNFKFV